MTMISSLLLAISFVPVATEFPVTVASALEAAQDPSANRGSASKGLSSPSGGTPEPMSVLLLAGGAVGYGVFRLARAKKQSSQES